MTKNDELQQAWDFAEFTDKSIFLTGKAGTGKTTFLKRMVTESTKSCVVVAPTGVAAINAGGVTIHSFFQLPLSPFVPNTKIKNKFDFSKDKRNIIRSIDLLIIDEISMVRSDLLDAIDSVLRRFRTKDKPFGGVQLLMIGDLQQLTPVVTSEDEAMLRPYYDTPYFFGSHALRQTDYVTIELKRVYRQQDAAFIDILNSIRDGHPSQEVINQLNSRYQPDFRPEPKAGYIRLTTHNQRADNYNNSELNRLPSAVCRFDAEITGNFPEYAYPTNVTLELKTGAQVMFVKNDPSGEHRYYNGRIGHIADIDNGVVSVLCPGDDEAITVEPLEWENAKYVLNKETREIETDVQGTFRQLPLRLAWAITIHKSQGLTFDRAIIDAALSFASGQVYVALSRCKTLEGMVMATPITPNAVINDQRVESYISHQEEEAQRSIAQLGTLKEEYYRTLMLELFDFNDIIDKEERLSRLFIEYFSHSYPQLTSVHKATLEHLKKDVSLIALKWSMLIQRQTLGQLHADDFLDRVVRSALYFKDELDTLLEDTLTQSAKVETNNKDAKKRLADALGDCVRSYQTKSLLLEAISKQEFSVGGYLKAKQNAIFDAMDGSPKASRRKRERKPKEKKERVDTKQVTLDLYRQGKTPAMIAQERNLSPQTINNHLAHFVGLGVLDIDEFVDRDKVAAIRQAIFQAGTENGKTAIKELCPPDVTYADITMVLELLSQAAGSATP